MTVDLLAAHPDLASRAVQTYGRCAATVRRQWGMTWRCHRPAYWRVKDHPAECGQHAAISLRRVLLDGDGSDP